MRQASPVGRENGKGFTGQGQRHLPPSDVSGQIPCQVTGKDFTRPTLLYVEPSRLARVVDKYQKQGACIIFPPSARVHLADYVPLPEPPKRARVRQSNSRPLICLTTGQFFGSLKDAGDGCHVFPQAITAHLKGAPHAKGYRFRYATDAEIERHDADPASWTFDEPLLPNLKPKKD